MTAGDVDVIEDNLQLGPVLGVRFAAISRKEALDRVEGLIRQPGSHRVVTANPEIVYAAAGNPELRQALDSASLVVADGVGILLAARLAGRSFPERVTGADLVEGLLERGAGRSWSFFFLGGKPGVAAEAARRAVARHPGMVVAGTRHGYFSPAEEEQVIMAIRDTRPDVLLAGLGAPKQELWLARHLATTGARVGIGVGGVLDVLAGTTRRAPPWMQRAGLEWLYRLSREPRRFRRMLVLPMFLLAAFNWAHFQRWRSQR